MSTPQEEFAALLKRVHSEMLKPLGYKKEGQNFRLFTPDGLGRIICFSKNRGNSKDYLLFRLDIGVYFEKTPELAEKRFKEYDCQLRQLVNRRDSGTLQKRGLLDLLRPRDFREDCEDKEWLITGRTDTEALFASVRLGVAWSLDWFGHFPDRETVVQSILTGEAQQFVWNNVLAYPTAKLLDGMGCGRQVYERIKDTDPVHCRVVQLAREIKEREGL